jgi:FixJ family two-component response regulator
MTARRRPSLLATLGTNVGLIVSDIRMPRLDGLQLAAVVSERWPTVPLILMSGQGGATGGVLRAVLREAVHA